MTRVKGVATGGEECIPAPVEGRTVIGEGWGAAPGKDAEAAVTHEGMAVEQHRDRPNGVPGSGDDHERGGTGGDAECTGDRDVNRHRRVAGDVAEEPTADPGDQSKERGGAVRKRRAAPGEIGRLGSMGNNLRPALGADCTRLTDMVVVGVGEHDEAEIGDGQTLFGKVHLHPVKDRAAAGVHQHGEFPVHNQVRIGVTGLDANDTGSGSHGNSGHRCDGRSIEDCGMRGEDGKKGAALWDEDLS